MLQPSLRRLALAGVLATLLLAALAGSAQATVTASAITSPATNSYFYYDVNAPSSTVFTVTGTTTGTGNVNLNCYYGGGYVPVLSNVTVTNNSFSVPITSAEADAAFSGASTCVLRAVDTSDTTDHPPGTSSPFSGPAVAVSSKEIHATGSSVYDFDYQEAGFSGWEEFTSAGLGGLSYGALLAPGTLTPSATSFDDLGALYDPELTQSGLASGGEITVDGTEALDSEAAENKAGALPGYEGITLTDSFNNGALTVDDDEPILDCVPSYSNCTSFKSSGVELDRTWQTADEGLLALQTDVFRSTDGAQHTLSVLENDGINSTSPPGASFDFPGSSGFQDYADNATVTLPSGPGTILFKTDSSTPDPGDGTNPQGAITYSSAPSGPVAFTFSDENNSGVTPEFVLPYNRTIPAGGAATLRFGYSQGYALSSVQALSNSVLASFAPAVSFTSPANGATVTSPTLAVSGAVSDPAGVSSVKVNGVAATLGSGGTFTAPVALTPGANTITAVATDSDGITGQAQVAVTYRNPPVVTTGKASKITSSGAKIVGTVNPKGQATTYVVQYGTTTAYASHTTAVSAGVGAAAITTSTTLKGLKAATTYHYRLMATNASGTTYGTGATFKTSRPAPKGLGAKVSPKTATSFPYHYTVQGKLSRPKGISAQQGCSGKITVKVKRGKKTIYTTHAKVTKKCTWSASVTLSSKGKVPGTGKLQITPSFGANKALAALTAKPLTVHYG